MTRQKRRRPAERLHYCVPVKRGLLQVDRRAAVLRFLHAVSRLDQKLGLAATFLADRDLLVLDEPTLGAIFVYSRDGGGHVTIYEGEDDEYYFCRGGNQSDAVNVARFPKSRKPVGIMWPAGLAMPKTGRVKTTFNAARSTKED